MGRQNWSYHPILNLHILLFTPRYCFLIMRFPTVGLTGLSIHPGGCAGQGGGRGNYKMIACSSDSNTSSKVSSVQVCVRRKLENNHRSICRVVHATRNPIVSSLPPHTPETRPRQRVERIVLTLSQSSHH